MKRLIALLLCLVLLLGALSVSAAADNGNEPDALPEAVETRSFSSSNRPIVFLNPDTLTTSMTAADVTIYSESTGCYLNVKSIYMVGGGDSLESSEHFQLGKRYQILFRLQAKTASDHFISGVTCRVDFGEFESTAECVGIASDGSYAYFLYNFSHPAYEVHGMYVNPFVDIHQPDYYFEPILWAYNQYPQITAGTDETHFSPNKSCSRAQVVTFLWRASGCPASSGITNPFKDVKQDDYFYTASLWAYHHSPQITAGTDSTHFSPNKDCTRAQVVTFLWRAELKPSVSGANPFKDVKSGDYFYTAVLWAVKNDITKGDTSTTFAPDKPCTRGQVMTFLYRAYGPKG